MKSPAVETHTRYGLMSRVITFSSVSAPVEGEQLLSKYEKMIFLVSKMFYCTFIRLYVMPRNLQGGLISSYLYET